MADQQPSFWARLKQHHLYRAAAWYGASIAVLIQIVARAFPYFGWSSAVPAVIIVLIAGFPVAIVLAWLLVKPADTVSQSVWQRRHWKLSAIVVPVVIAAVAVSGVYAFHYAEQHEARVATEQAIARTTAVQATANSAAPASATVIPAKSIAVLPFENLSDDKKNDYFVAGMQDLILTKLADIGDLKVIARTSTAKYPSHPEDLKAIGRQLGVATILEGSVQKQGKQVLINVQLIDTGTQSHLWAQDYTRTLDNVFGVEGEVAEKIATALDAKLTHAETARLAAVPTQNQAAFDLFLRAEYQTNQGEIGGYNPLFFAAAIPLYRQAIKRDPGFALAYARLSYVESALAWEGASGQDVGQLDARARADAEQALKLAPDLAASQLALGYNDYLGHLDYDGALKAFAAALALRPNDPDALEAQGLAQRRMGRFDAAIASLEQAFTQNPRNSVLAEDIGSTYMGVGRYPDAERWSSRALTLDPGNISATEDLVHSILLGSGDVARALAAADPAPHGSTAPTGYSNRMKVGTRVPLLIYQRQYRQALDLLDSVPGPNIADPYLRYVIIGKPQTEALLFRLLGEPERAKPLYEQVLPILRTQLKVQQDRNLALVWNRIAEAELGLGHTAKGLDAVARSQDIASRSNDRISAARLMELNAGLYAQIHRSNLAVPLVAKSLATPGIGDYYSPVMLWLDPAWDPIRNDPRFQALLQQYAKFKPAVTYDGTPASASSTP